MTAITDVRHPQRGQAITSSSWTFVREALRVCIEERRWRKLQRDTAARAAVLGLRGEDHVERLVDDDNRILECAVAARADYLITEDRQHPLPRRSVGGIPIITPAAFIEFLDAARPAVECRG